MRRLAQLAHGRLHYAWISLAVVFLVLVAAAGIRATPSVVMLPWESDFGWSRAAISGAQAINLALFGLTGPFAAAAMQRFGIRRTVMSALALLAASAALSASMAEVWQLMLLWGALVGAAAGATASTLSVTVVNRWFAARRGLAMGVLSGSMATGQMVFLPLLASVVESQGWRPVVWIVAGGALAVLVLVWLLLPESPAQLQLRPYGDTGTGDSEAGPRGNPLALAFGALRQAIPSVDFWLLFFSFFVCGVSTNGYIGSHFIAMCGDHGLSELTGAGILAGMGLLDLLGTTLSGWLTDRYSSRVLLFFYYGLRGIALLYLPYAFEASALGLPAFALFYGLDWIATVPPTVRLITEVFGSRSAPMVFGWIFTGHQLGAAVAALGAGSLRAELGSYTPASIIAGALCVASAMAVLRIARQPAAAAA
jgi:predicted MFS family arabinose efflux permease